MCILKVLNNKIIKFVHLHQLPRQCQKCIIKIRSFITSYDILSKKKMPTPMLSLHRAKHM